MLLLCLNFCHENPEFGENLETVSLEHMKPGRAFSDLRNEKPVGQTEKLLGN